MSIASMKAEPMMPNTSVTPWATSVSTKASEGVIRCLAVHDLAVALGHVVHGNSSWLMSVQ